MRRTLYTETLAVAALPEGSIATDTTTAGTSVDLNVFNNLFAESVLFVLRTGTVTDGEYAVTLEESSDNVSFDPVPAHRVQGSLPTVVAADDNALFQFGYVPGTARYVRLSIVSTDTTTGGALSAVAVLSGGVHRPVKRS